MPHGKFTKEQGFMSAEGINISMPPPGLAPIAGAGYERNAGPGMCR